MQDDNRTRIAMTTEQGQPAPSGAPLVYALSGQALRLFAAVQVARKAAMILPGRTEITVPAADFAEVDVIAKEIEATQTAGTALVHEAAVAEIRDRAAFAAELERFCRKWADYEPTRREAIALRTAWDKVAPRFERKG